MLSNTFTVAILDDFLDAFARIPRAQQKKVNKFLRKFRSNPTDPSINYESISTFADPNLRTVRIDLSYRAIVLKPESGNVYLLLWVDHHDEAMRWAQNKRIEIHPTTGGLQVLSAVPVAVETTAKTASEQPALYVGVRDRELARLGVPESCVAAVRDVDTLAQLEEIQDELPPEAFEALYWLGEGESLEEVERAMAVTVQASVDTTDFLAALDRDASKRRFVTVEDDSALEAMLDAPLQKWRVFLHPSQRRLVARTWSGPVRVLGGAGTGKTVVAMHRAVYLAEKVFKEPTDRILFTTFTRNLAADISANLDAMCSPDVKRRIEVTHIDKWVAGLLKRAGYGYKLAYWGQGDTLQRLWDLSMQLADPASKLEDSFYRDEWELVIQPNGCARWEDYKRASRAGRGSRLNRSQRKQAWAVFEEYRRQLERQGLREPEDALRDATTLLKEGKVRVSLRSIIVDEAQDMSTNAFRLLRQAIPTQQANDLFIVGDGHQRIYRKKVVLSRAGVAIVGRSHRLRINYRTTDEIRRYAIAVLEGTSFDDLDGEADTTARYRSLMHGEAPELLIAEDFDREVGAIAQWVQEGALARTAVVARTNSLVERYTKALEARGIETRQVKRSEADDPSLPGLRMATMHRVKGLEFDRVVVAGMSEENMPWRRATERLADAAAREDAEAMERALLYVALTRARKAVLVTAVGAVSGWVDRLSKAMTSSTPQS